MSKYWVIADTQFNHVEKMMGCCGRPQNYEQKILQHICNIPIHNEDVLIHLGDICIGRDKYWNNALTSAYAGKKILVRGNHDKKSNSWYMNHGWDIICESFIDRMYGALIWFSHKPIGCPELYDMNIHGHFHNSSHHIHEPELVAIKNDKQMLFCLENEHYAPVPLRTLVNRKFGNV